jgi:hypothetical protein
MKNLSFYEQVGVVIPGAVLLLGLTYLIPDLRPRLTVDNATFGDLGVFLVIAYAAGHLLGAFGTMLDRLYWPLWGGMPSDWIVGASPRLLTALQIDKVQALTRSRLGLTIAPLAELSRADWFPVFRQIYSDVEKNGKPDRGDTFNGNYGLNRGLCVATFLLAVGSMIEAPSQRLLSFALLCLAAIFLRRMHEFGELYAREIYNQFLLLPADPSPRPKVKVRRIVYGA